MTFLEYIPYVPAVLGVLLLVMYAFMRHEVTKALTKPAGVKQATLATRAQAYTLMANSEAGFATATTRYYTVAAATGLAYAATLGAWLPEATDWGGLFATWWWLMLALVLNIAALVLHQRVLSIQAHGIQKLQDSRKTAALTNAHLYGDSRWYAQKQATTKYLIAALVCFIVAVGCALYFW